MIWDIMVDEDTPLLIGDEASMSEFVDELIEEELTLNFN